MAEQTTEVVLPAQDFSIRGSLQSYEAAALSMTLILVTVCWLSFLTGSSKTFVGWTWMLVSTSGTLFSVGLMDVLARNGGHPPLIRIPILVLAAGLMSVAMLALALAGMIAHGTPTCCTPAPDPHRGTTPSSFLEF